MSSFFEIEFEEVPIIIQYKHEVGLFDGYVVVDVTAMPEKNYYEVHGRDVPVFHGAEWEIEKIFVYDVKRKAIEVKDDWLFNKLRESLLKNYKDYISDEIEKMI
jgi:hypothetical protein